LITAIIISLIWSTLVLWPKLTDYYRVPGDVRTFYWMAKYQDSALFPHDDFLARNDLVELDLGGNPVLLYPTSLGYGLLFYATSFLVEPIIFGKLLFILLVPISVVALYKFGKTITGSEEVAFILSILFVYFNVPSSTAMSVASGLQRAFALPILIMFLYILEKKRYQLASLFIPISALIYLPNALLIAVTYLFSLVKLEKDSGFSLEIGTKEIIPFVCAVSFTLPFAIWGLVDLYDWFDSSAFYILIRETPNLDHLFVGFPWLGKTSFFTKLGDAFDFLALLFLSILIYLTRGQKSLKLFPSIGWQLLSAGFFLYFLSLGAILLFSSTALYLPSRYSRLPLFLVTLIFVGVNGKSFLDYILVNIVFVTKIIAFTIFAILGAFVLLDYFLGEPTSILYVAAWIELFVFSLLAVSIYTFHRAWVTRPRHFLKIIGSIILVGVSVFLSVFHAHVVGFLTLNPTHDQRTLYSYVTQLPKDIVLSGSPDELSDITLFSQRDVLIKDFEPDNNYDLQPDNNMPIVEAMDAYYAENPAAIVEFCQRYGVDYLVRDEKDFAHSFINKGQFFSLDNEVIQERVSGRKDFALMHMEPVFQSGPLAVIECDDDLVEQK
jgi:hypothetical protein